MPTREDMQGLRQEITAAHDQRNNEIADLKNSTHTLLAEARAYVGELDAEYRDFAAKLRSDMTKYEADRKNEARRLGDERMKANADMKSCTHEQMSGFEKEHRDMAKTLRENLGEFHTTLMNETRQLKDERMKDLYEMKASVHSELRELANTRAGAEEAFFSVSFSPKPRAKRG